MAILEVNELKQHFYINPGLLAKMVSGKKPSVIKAVDGLTFSLEPGEIMGVAGDPVWRSVVTVDTYKGPIVSLIVIASIVGGRFWGKYATRTSSNEAPGSISARHWI